MNNRVLIHAVTAKCVKITTHGLADIRFHLLPKRGNESALFTILKRVVRKLHFSLHFWKVSLFYDHFYGAKYTFILSVYSGLKLPEDLVSALFPLQTKLKRYFLLFRGKSCILIVTAWKVFQNVFVLCIYVVLD